MSTSNAFGCVLIATLFTSALSAQVSEIQKILPVTSNSQARFGTSLSVSGSRAAIGSPSNGQAAPTAGSVFVFDHQADGSWTQAAQLIAADASSSDHLGASVSISGDTVLAGANLADAAGTNSGAAYIFERQPGGSWLQTQKLVASDAEVADEFGGACAIDGNYAVIAAWKEDQSGSLAGAAYVFERQTSGTWIQVQKLLASDGEDADDFGWSVALSGARLVVGADRWDQNDGAAYVFERQPSGVWSEVTRLTASDAKPFSYFGQSVAIEGDLIVVGADRAYQLGVPATEFGAVYVFHRSPAGTWSQVDRLQALDAGDTDNFGESVSISNGRILVGARNNDELGNDAGAAYLFEPAGQAWLQVQKLTGSETALHDLMGRAVAISGDSIFVGSPNDDDQGTNSGSAYTFDAEPLSGTPATLSLSTGGTQVMQLDAGHLHAGDLYLLLGTFSGTSPGLPAAPGISLPLTADTYFFVTLNHPNQPPIGSSFGLTNASGHSTATFTIPATLNPGLAGTVFNHAFLTIDALGAGVTFASNALSATLVP